MYNGILRSHKKNEITSLVTIQMDLEIIILSKPERERQILYGITYVWNIKYDANEPIHKQNQIRRHSEQTYCCQGGEEEGEGWTDNGDSR